MINSDFGLDALSLVHKYKVQKKKKCDPTDKLALLLTLSSSYQYQLIVNPLCFMTFEPYGQRAGSGDQNSSKSASKCMLTLYPSRSSHM